MDSSLAGRLEDGDRRATVTAFPDGSVDHFYRVFSGGRRVERREEFTELVSDGRSSAVTLESSAVEPGGHAVNMAAQADLLGDDVSLVGHLDDPVFDELPFETVSMGDPARVAVHGFDDGDVLTVEPSADVRGWSFEDLRAATGASFEALLSADVVFCTNWTTFDAIPAALAELAAAGCEGGHFVFDPGGVRARTDDEIHRLFDALADLAASYSVVLAANAAEVESLAAAVTDDEHDPGGLEACLDWLRRAGDLTAAVVHEAEAAVAVTSDERRRVENFAVDPVRHTGGGDRFDAGLAYALARDWPLADALTLGNACASRYVATGASGTPEELAAFLREHE